jgi:cytochrome c556
MAMRSRLIGLAVALVSFVTLAACLSRAEEKKPADKDKANVWMKKKLEFSQNIQAGLTEGNFEKISKNAEAMGYLDFLEQWSKGAKRADYKRQLSHFDFANQELIRQAKEKNLEGATLAFNQLTVSCVQCHKIVRDANKP